MCCQEVLFLLQMYPYYITGLANSWKVVQLISRWIQERAQIHHIKKCSLKPYGSHPQDAKASMSSYITCSMCTNKNPCNHRNLRFAFNCLNPDILNEKISMHTCKCSSLDHSERKKRNFIIQKTEGCIETERNQIQWTDERILYSGIKTQDKCNIITFSQKSADWHYYILGKTHVHTFPYRSRT